MGEKRPGEFEQLLLFALVRLGEGAQGNAVREEIQRCTGRVVTPGALYTAMDRLERQALVTSWLGDATPSRGGRRKKHYRIEPAGAKALADSYLSLQGMAGGVVPRLLALAGDTPERVPE